MLNKTDFFNPPLPFREVPFWSWNDELDQQELTRQIYLMKQAGWGGFFMHSRIGLKTSYMSKEWMQSIRTCVNIARQLNLHAWLYDEDKWPSGFAGGLSVTANPDYRAQYLVCKVDDRPAFLHERLITFHARIRNGILEEIQEDQSPAFQDRYDRMIQFYIQTMPLSDPWFNGYAYLNLLNPVAVRAFLDSTHEVYKQAIGNEFGKVVPGIFTDEPCTYFRVSRSASPEASVPWEARLPKIFLERRGYEIIPKLPALFFDMEGAYQVRIDFWRTVTEMFLEAFSKQYAEWCDQHHLVFTGHYMSEDTMLSQIQWGLASAMPHYAWMDVPGVDKLGRQIGRMYGRTLTMKQLDSVGCQTGKKRILVENYALSGQNFAHQGRKWLADWAAVLGANFHNTHLSLYSMRGERKRDCPPNLFFQQPWWSKNKFIADYSARLAYVLSQGERVVDILIIHPMLSAWALFKPGGTAGVEHLDNLLDQLLNLLLQQQRDFHLGDEMMMEQDGSTPASVENISGKAFLQVGKMKYQVVIIPPLLTLSRNTIEILAKFRLAGGKIVAIKPLQTTLTDQLYQIQLLPEGTQILSMEALPQYLDQVLPRWIRIDKQPNIWVHHRKVNSGKDLIEPALTKERDIFFLANTSLEDRCTAHIELFVEGLVEEWNLADGSVTQVPVQYQKGKVICSLEFAPAGSHLLVVTKIDQPTGSIQVIKPKELTQKIPVIGPWKIIYQDQNSLVLDKARLAFDNEDWSPAQDILSIQSLMVAKGIGTSFQLLYEFSIRKLPKPPIYLVMESPEEFETLVNEQPVQYHPSTGWWIDPSFRKLDISHAIQTGENQVLIKGKMKLETELEAIYLLGNFGVSRKFIRPSGQHSGEIFDEYSEQASITQGINRLYAKSRKGRIRYDLTIQGFPNYAGRVIIQNRFFLPFHPNPNQKILVKIDNLRAAVAQIYVNQQDCGTISWQPHCLDITHALHINENLIEIELTNTLRNLLGPLHLSGGESDYTGPGEYRDQRLWTDNQILTPFGFDQVNLEIYQ